jgi:hypothetical protein
VGDLNNEPNQTFMVVLSSPVGASIVRATATATIVNDDAAPGKLLRFAFDPIASPQLVDQPLSIAIRALDHLDQPAGFSGAVVLSANIQVANTYFTNLVIAPSNASGFVNGVWTGSVTVHPAATNVYLTVTDLQEHVGTSGLFQIIAPEVIRFAQFQMLTNGIFQMSVEGLIGETYTLWTSTALNDWVEVRNFVCTNSPTIVTDTGGLNHQQRFYRIVRRPISP